MQAEPGAVPRSASLSVEALLVLPVLLVVILGGIELGLLLSARHQLFGACREVGRLAALGHDRPQLASILVQYLGESKSANAELIIADEHGQTVHSPREIPAGRPVMVIVRLPATCAAPDLLRLVGFSLRNQILEVQTVWRRE
uniref:TadE-like domain-containing protein n=1 Tax=uncultured Planctomycetota bacterium TaxID=120965 RepID=H5SD11_9BACT|nr:hypothetical protein HGMM_F12C05C30 [uncultured Planctomycetota bacterium]